MKGSNFESKNQLYLHTTLEFGNYRHILLVIIASAYERSITCVRNWYISQDGEGPGDPWKLQNVSILNLFYKDSGVVHFDNLGVHGNLFDF